MRCDSAAHAHAMRFLHMPSASHSRCDAMSMRDVTDVAPTSNKSKGMRCRCEVWRLAWVGRESVPRDWHGGCSKADQGLLGMGYDAMSQCPAMSADSVPKRCDTISIVGQTPMSDDAMQSDVAQAAMTCAFGRRAVVLESS